MLALLQKVNEFLSLAAPPITILLLTLVKRSEMRHNDLRFAFPSRQVMYRITQ